MLIVSILITAESAKKFNNITHTQLFYGPFSRRPRRAGARRKNFYFMVQGEISEADTPTIRRGATPTD